MISRIPIGNRHHCIKIAAGRFARGRTTTRLKFDRGDRIYDYDSAFDVFKYIHDLCLVGPPEIQAPPLWGVILISWLIAFFEYCFQVPANRWGYGQFTAVELKTIQEVISLTVFSFFSVFYLGKQMRWNYVLGFALLAAGAFFLFKK